MFKTRGRKILRDIMARKGRTALVSISIMIGVFGAVALISANDLLIKQIRDDIESDEIAMTRLYVTVPSAGTDVQTEAGEDQILDLVRTQKDVVLPPSGIVGVTQIEGQAITPAFWRTAGSENRYREADLMAFSEPFDAISLEPMRKVEGEWPVAGNNEIAVERRMADEYGLSVGDEIQFRPLGTDTGEAATWTISAIVFHPYWVGNEDGNPPERRIFATVEDAHLISSFSGYSSYYLRYVDTQTAHTQADDLMELIANETDYIPQGYWLDDPDDYFLIGEVQEITNILNMLAIVALVVSGFLVTNVISTIITEQKRQIGVLKSMGATRMDNFVIYAGIAAVYGIIGTIPGVIIGVLVGSLMAQSFAPLAHTLIEGFNVSIAGVVIGAVMGVLVPIVAALLPVFNGTRVTIIEAMTDLGISTNWGTGPIARFIKALPFPANIRQAMSNMMQKKGRLALTVITLTFAAAASMGVFAMFSVITDEIGKLFDTFQYEAMIMPSEPQDFDQMNDAIMQVDAIEDVNPGVAFMVRFLDLNGSPIIVGPEDVDELQAFGMDPAAKTLDFTYDAGTGWDDDPERRGVVLTKPAAESLDKTVGDQVVISAGGRSAQFEVIGVASYPFPFVALRWQDLSQLAGFVDDNGTPDDATDDIPLPIVFFAKTVDDDLSATAVDDTISDVSEVLLDNGVTASFMNQQAEEDTIAESMLVFNMIFQITSGVMAAVGAIGLLTTLSMAVFERQKEIGVMRSIGAGSGTIVTQFLVEGVLIGVLAWIVAIPLSYLLALLLLDGLQFSEFVDFSFPVWVWGMGLVGMIVIASIASLWPSISAARRTVSDILRYQ
ncbi:MAG: ABC transporter permease [Anaerolineae bacterium]|nr:ABC transporter permease [Anaerolineae bacterium]